MEIISWNFFAFVVVVLPIYYLLNNKWQKIWLLISSYAFYVFWDYKYLIVLLFVTIINYLVAHRLFVDGKKNKKWLWLGLFINIGSLSLLKMVDSGYAMRLAGYLFRLTGSPETLSISILLPIGFSFYILQAISYLFDVYHGRLSACRNILDFSIYLAYFPKLVSGPIERAKRFLPILENQRIVNNEKVSQAFGLIVIGLVRKILIADVLSRNIPENLFTSFHDYTSSTIIIGLLIYAFWLYNDFAGYTSIVRGVSLLFGIELTPNFQQPYFSSSFTEFWNRWHISLSHWLRDYIFYPTSRWLLRRNRNPKNLVNVVVPPMATMLISGLWHRFAIYMVFWGGLHGVYQVVERLISLWKPASIMKVRESLKHVMSVIVVFVLTMFAWVAFGSGSFIRIFDFWASMFVSSGKNAISAVNLFDAVGVIAICLIIDWAQYRAGDELVFLKKPKLVQAFFLAMAIFAFFLNYLWGETTVTPFIYQGF